MWSKMWGRGVALLITMVVSVTVAVLVMPSQALAQVTAAKAAPTRTARWVNWSQYGFDSGLANYNPFETTISPANVARLKLGWSFPLTGSLFNPTPSPVLADGVVYVAISIETPTSKGMSSYLYALPERGCVTTCHPLWKAAMQSSATGVVVANHTIYAPAGNILYAFPEGRCSGWCQPLWTFTLPNDTFAYAPTFANGIIYIGSLSGTVYALNGNGCGHTTCTLSVTSHVSRIAHITPHSSAGNLGQVAAPPVVANGFVYVGYVNGTIAVYKARGCGQVVCTPLWTASTTGINQFLSAPATLVVSQGVIYAVDQYSQNTMNNVFAFPAGGCGKSVCPFIWSTKLPYIRLMPPAVANGVIYIPTSDDYGDHGTLYAFPVRGCKVTCRPLWHSSLDMGYGQVSIANGVVYVGNFNKIPKYAAFPASGCRNVVCAPLWIYSLPGHNGDNPYILSPVVANGTLFISTSTAILNAFHL